MNRSEAAGIIVIASVSVLIAYLVAGAIIGKPTGSSVRVKTAVPITADVTPPDSSIFNSEAINPTVEVVIGDQ